VSEGCAGRCGPVRDQCGRLLNCGPCPSSCGDGLCDPGEWIECQDDCGQNCQPQLACGLRCGLVDDGCGFYIDCGPCEGVCGNGLCETGETHAACPEDCPLPGCVSNGCNGGCGALIDNCGQLLQCGTCGGYSQCPHPNGICEPDLGEDELNCKWECPVGCGDGICTPAERLRCPSDCGGAPPPDGISAGGPYAGLVGEPVHFFGLVAPSISAAGYEWSFGDGASAGGLTPTHTYDAPGVYEVGLRVALVGGGELLSLTSARIAGQAGTSGFSVGFEMYYDALGDGIVAVSQIAEDGSGPPGSPKTPATAIAIWDPRGTLVDQTGWLPAVAEVNPTFVPQLAHPMPGVWRGRALFGYVDAANPFAGVIYLGDRWATARVPNEQCSGCLTLAPSAATIEDGDSQGFTATPNSSPPPDTASWGYAKPPGSSSVGSVEFTGSALNVDARGTWFAHPDQSCVPQNVLADQAMRNAKYTISAHVQTGGQLATGQAELTVQMPWGIGAELGGTESAAATFPPSLEGDISVWCPTTPSPANPCHVSGNTLVRTAPTICWPETQGHTGCAAYQQRFQLMPQSSSFRNKVDAHESVHVQQFAPGRYFGDLWTIDGPHGLMSFTVPGRGVPLRNLTAPSFAQISTLIAATRAAWRNWSEAETLVRKPGSEPEAYAISDGVPPAYLLQGCNALP
jgi:hypothetical protein